MIKQASPTNKHALTIKICHASILQPKSHKSHYEAFDQAVDSLWASADLKIGPVTYHRIFEIIHEKQMFKSLFPLLSEESRRNDIIEQSRLLFEKKIQNQPKSGSNYVNDDEQAPNYHFERAVSNRHKTLVVIQKSLNEYAQYEASNKLTRPEPERRLLGLVMKQVADVLEVYNEIQGSAE